MSYTTIVAMAAMLLGITAHARTLGTVTLEECLSAAAGNHPQYKVAALLERSRAYSLENTARGYLPRVSISGQATYQSDVTSVPIPITIPGFSIEPPSRDQYRIVAEVAQTIYDGGASARQADMVTAAADIEAARQGTDEYRLKERIHQVYFSILLMQSQLETITLQKDNLDVGVKVLTAAERNGTALPSSTDALRAEILKVRQRELELQAGRSAYVNMMALLTGLDLDDSLRLAMPQQIQVQQTIERPELRSFVAQQHAIDAQKESIDARYMPRFEAFVQGGYARPGLNMLKNEFAAYYVGGIRMSWSITDMYSSSAERSLADVNRGIVDVQREAFLLTTRTQLTQQQQDAERFRKVLDLDDDIVALRTGIRTTASKQLAGGVITANDYVRVVNDEEAAIRERATHTVQLRLAEYSQMLTTGK